MLKIGMRVQMRDALSLKKAVKDSYLMDEYLSKKREHAYGVIDNICDIGSYELLSEPWCRKWNEPLYHIRFEDGGQGNYPISAIKTANKVRKLQKQK